MVGEEKQWTVNYLKYGIILGIVFILALAGGYWFNSKISQVVADIKEKRATIKTLDNRDQSYQQLQTDFEKIADRYKQIDQALPSEENFVSFIISMEKEAGKRDVKLNIVFPEQPIVEANQLMFQVDISGKLINVIKYLQDLQSGPYYIQIESVNLSKYGGLSGEVSGQVNIKVGVDEAFQASQVSN